MVVQPNETIDQAQDLGTIGQPVEASGSIGDGPAGAADVTWYHFQLEDAARVDLKVVTPAGGPAVRERAEPVQQRSPGLRRSL